MTVYKDRQTCHDLFWSPKIDYMVSTIWVSALFWNLEIPYVDGAGSEQWLECEFKPNDRMFLTFLRLKLGPSSFVSGDFYTIREGLEIIYEPPKIQILNKTLSLFFISN